MSDERSYPAGVTCWVDTEQPDVDAARDFYAACSAGRSPTPYPPTSLART